MNVKLKPEGLSISLFKNVGVDRLRMVYDNCGK